MKLLSITSGIKFNPAFVVGIVFLPKDLKTIVTLTDGLKIVSDYDFKTTCEIVERGLSIDEANALKVRSSLCVVEDNPKTSE